MKSPLDCGTLTEAELRACPVIHFTDQRECRLPPKNTPPDPLTGIPAFGIRTQRVNQFAWCADCGTLANGFVRSDRPTGRVSLCYPCWSKTKPKE